MIVLNLSFHSAVFSLFPLRSLDCKITESQGIYTERERKRSANTKQKIKGAFYYIILIRLVLHVVVFLLFFFVAANAASVGRRGYV